jgi:ankyrin repeat protein
MSSPASSSSAAAAAAPPAGAAASGGGAAAAAAQLVGAPALAVRARAAAAASAVERAECEARFVAACAAALASGAPAPFRGPAADSALGESFLDIVALVSANGFELDARPARYLCGLTLREGVRRSDGSLDRAGFLGGTADMIGCALRLQAPWLEAARRAPRGGGGRTSLMTATTADDSVVAGRRVRELLAAGAPWRCVDGGRWTALHFASTRADARVAAALLEADAAGDVINAQDSLGCTPLILASMKGHEGTVSALLAHGARQELQHEDGDMALQKAARNGHAGIVERLCSAPGASAAIALQDKRGRSLLSLASENGLEGAVRLLLARGTRQELQDKSGMTALHYAAWKGHAGVIKLLCAAPCAAAALALRESWGRTPLAFAVAFKRNDCAALLRANGAS